MTLDEAIRRRLGPLEVRIGRSVRVGRIELRIRSLTHRGAIDGISMVILRKGRVGVMLSDRSYDRCSTPCRALRRPVVAATRAAARHANISST